MFYRCFIILLLIFSTGSVSFGQDWYNAIITLENENVITGEISYQASQDALFLRAGDAIMVIPAFRIKSFSYFNRTTNKRCRFVTLPYSIGSATSYEFYEIIVEGPISLLRQQSDSWYTFLEETIVFDYFILKDESLVRMNEFKRHIYPSLKKLSGNLHDFARKNRIDVSNIDDTIRFIRYYNDEQSCLPESWN